MNDSEQTASNPYPTLAQSWGLFGYILLATIAIVVFFFIFTTVLTAFGLQGKAIQMANDPWLRLLMYALPFVVVLWLALKRKKRQEPGVALDFHYPGFEPLSLIMLTTWCIYFLVDPIVDLLPMPKFFDRLILQLLSDHSLPAILMLVIAAPICEELLFRGIILNGLLKRYSPQKAIMWSAIIFGVVHLNPWQFIAAVALGLFMGWIYYRTGSLFATMFIHFVANGTGLVLGWLLVPDPDAMLTTRQMVGSNTLYFGLLVVDVALLVGMIVLLKNQFAEPAEQLPA